MQIVRNLCLYRRRTHPACFVPDSTQFPQRHQAVRPYIFTEAEVIRLLAAANQLRPNSRSPLCPENFRLALVLLYTMGLRRGELLRLATGRSVKTVRLGRENGRWIFDIDEFRESISSRSRLLLLCHPHNPVGRAFGGEELAAIAEICLRNDLLVCSDEIHCDLMLDPRKHIPFASLSEEIANRTVTLMSPAKTFNTTGLNCGFAVIPNHELRGRFQEATSGMVPQPNALGYAACRSAFEEGEEWRVELIRYLRGNRDLLESYISEQLPMFRMSHVEATYLAWIDTRWLGARNTLTFFEKAGVRLSDGTAFNGPGFMRLNFGCPRATLQDALDRILRAVNTPNKPLILCGSGYS